MMFRDTLETIYPLGDSDIASVRRGDTVVTGDVIAHGPGPVAIAAYAATLRRSVDDAADELARHHGSACEVGTSLGTRRVSLVTRTVLAPATGTVHSLPHSGALVIRSDRDDFEHQARYPSVVRDVRDDAITITSAVARTGYAFRGGDTHPAGQIHIEPALQDVPFTTGTIPRAVPSTSSLVLAHLGDLATLQALARSERGLFLVGSVAEPVAWSLLSRTKSRESHSARLPSVIVLSGIGDLAHGVNAVAPFRDFHGARVILDRPAHTVTLIPAAGRFPEADVRPDSPDRQSAVRRDPANYDVSCEIHGAPVVATLTGARLLCVWINRGSAGARIVPRQNLLRE